MSKWMVKHNIKDTKWKRCVTPRKYNTKQYVWSVALQLAHRKVMGKNSFREALIPEMKAVLAYPKHWSKQKMLSFLESKLHFS